MNKVSFRSLLILCLTLLAPLHAEEKGSQAKLRLPWELLQSVLKLDAKDVRLSWDEYRTLIQLTGSGKMPDFKMAGGDVVLSRTEFTRLVQSLVPPAPLAAEASVTKASYRGRLERGSALFSATLRLEVPRRPAQPIRVDLFPGNVAFQEITLDRRPALARVENGRLYLTVAEAGSHRVDLRFSVSVPESNAAQSLVLPIARTPITEWILDIPEPNLDIAVTPALHREITALGRGTRVRALLPPSDSVTAAWNPLAPDTAKGPPQIYADVDHLISVQEDALRIKSRIGLDVLQNTINTLTLELPEGFAVLDVQGEAVREWQENNGRPATLSVPLRSARKGRMDFNVTLERVLSSIKSTTSFSGVTVRGAVRQRGFLGVELNTNAELPAPVTEGLEPKDPFRELPPALTAQSARLLYGYKYVRPPFTLSLALTRHESVNVIPSVIDRAVGSTVIRPDGKRVHRITYYLRSAAKQFLEVALPERTELWSAFVDGAPVKPLRGEGKKTLIPLVRSLRASSDAFPVELVYYEARGPLPFLGREDLRLPMPDVLVSRLSWSVETPPDHAFHYWGRDFEKLQPSAGQLAHLQQTDEGSTLMTGGIGGNKVGNRKVAAQQGQQFRNLGHSRSRLDDARDKDRFEPEEMAAMGDMVQDASLEIDGGDLPGASPPVLEEFKKTAGNGAMGGGTSATAGVLPVRVTVPSFGNFSTYTKTLPEPNTLLTLRLTHAASWVLTTIQLLPWIGFGILVWVFRPFIRREFVKVLPVLKAASRRAGPAASPFGLLFTGLAFVLAASYGPSFLFGVALVVFSMALIRWALSLLDPAEGEIS